jgi:hypothetical protein
VKPEDGAGPLHTLSLTLRGKRLAASLRTGLTTRNKANAGAGGPWDCGLRIDGREGLGGLCETKPRWGGSKFDVGSVKLGGVCETKPKLGHGSEQGNARREPQKTGRFITCDVTKLYDILLLQRVQMSVTLDDESLNHAQAGRPGGSYCLW